MDDSRGLSMVLLHNSSTASDNALLWRTKSWRQAFSAHKAVEDLFAHADIRLDGARPWDIQVHNERLFRRILAAGSLGLGEAYMDGDWDCPAVDQLFDRLISAKLADRLGMTLPLVLLMLAARLSNRQSIARAGQVAKAHYDLPADIHEATYDNRLTGSCAYWKDSVTLDEAQENKLDLICRKVALQAGHTVFDIGCGWGSFIGFAAERYGARCTGITVSAEQVAYAMQRYAGLPVEALLMDYRGYQGPKVDRIVSVGMFEHVGSKNYRTYFDCARRLLKDEGIFLLHTIWENERYPVIDAWQDKYIFPNGDLPSLGQITSALEGLFVVEDVHNFGAYYDQTLMAWNANFQSRRSQMAARHGERFCRMWEYYLLQNAGAFRCRHISVGQLVLTPHGLPGGYQSAR
jgi:cyclopropane-fatty-acyl-phospholipid synthase